MSVIASAGRIVGAVPWWVWATIVVALVLLAMHGPIPAALGAGSMLYMVRRFRLA